MPKVEVQQFSEGEFKTYNQLSCPFCPSQIGFLGDVIDKELECPSCKKKFSFDDGFIERIATTKLEVHRMIATRLGVIQIGNAKIKAGECSIIKFKKPFFKVSIVLLTDSEGTIHDTIETDDYLVSTINLTNDGFQLISSRKNSFDGDIHVGWMASGAESDRKVPVWHIFLQNAIDLLNKAEYGATIVMSMMAFDSYRDKLFSEILSTKHALPKDLTGRIVTSAKFGRKDFLGYWMKNLLGKSFTEECPLNGDLKKFGDMRNAIVHPSQHDLNEGDLNYENAEKCLEVSIQSIKWINDLKLGKV